MLSIIIGGAGSGKSAFAEKLVCRLPGQRLYIATMIARDTESVKRIEKHRKQRAGQGFRTLERETDLAGAVGIDPTETLFPKRANALLEDLSNLLANEMFSQKGGGMDAVRKGLRALLERCGNLTVVTNEIFSDGVEYEGETLAYLRNLARFNRDLAGEADLVVEVVCGLPNVLKGKLP